MHSQSSVKVVEGNYLITLWRKSQHMHRKCVVKVLASTRQQKPRVMANGKVVEGDLPIRMAFRAQLERIPMKQTFSVARWQGGRGSRLDLEWLSMHFDSLNRGHGAETILLKRGRTLRTGTFRDFSAPQCSEIALSRYSVHSD